MSKITIEQLKSMSKEQMAALILSMNQPKALTVKISAADPAKGTKGGAVCVYGLHSRFPVSLYRSQWERLFAFLPELKAFMEANKAALDVVEQRKAS